MKGKQDFKNGELTLSLILNLISIVLFIFSLRMYMDNPHLSSQGSFPLFVTSLMVIISILITFRIIKNINSSNRESHINNLKNTINYLLPGKILQILAMILLYGVLLSKFGFEITTFGFLFISMLLLHKKNILKLLIISTGILIGILIIFKYIFAIVLP